MILGYVECLLKRYIVDFARENKKIANFNLIQQEL